DILVNNAGIFPPAPALDLSEATWDRVLSVNLKGAFFLAQAVAQQMIRQGDGGAIVNIASIDALHPTGRLAHYDTSKAGLVMMTRSLAFELGPNRIRVNAVAPGVIQTPGADAALAVLAGSGSPGQLKSKFVSRIPLGRLGTPDDVARAVLFLVSEAADYITGSTLVVDGGFLLS
ncbi:MAG TPA: SDR family oxidoreductase, partial [Polyangiaceae bacterium]|nr:SDR family oxidoreductase [Polyangiaceae bacterium]